jgi:hypothetical protein
MIRRKAAGKMSATRTGIVVSWSSFLLFCALLAFAWEYRLLWLALFLPAWLILSLVGLRTRQPRALMLLFGVAFGVFLFAFIVHGFLFPRSQTLTRVMKVLCALSLAPALGYKAYVDYVAFRRSAGGSFSLPPASSSPPPSPPPT